MIKALLKKQMLEVFAWIYKDNKSGKLRSKKGSAGYGFLYLLIFSFLGFIFYFVANTLCRPLIDAKIGWLYFALMGLIAIALGVFGSVFNTFSSLYLAKDNDLLLSTPVNPSSILIARLSGVFAMGFMYELIVIIPTLIVYFINAPLSGLSVIFSLLIPFLLSIVILTLSCILGWVVAKISVKIKHKNIITVFVSLVFIVAYYYFYSKAYTMLQAIISNPLVTGEKIKGILYPLYHMGLASEGNALSMLIFTAIVLAFFAIVYIILSKSFLKIATASSNTKKAKVKHKRIAEKSVSMALLNKELRRFTGSSLYMLNCGLGIVIMPIASIALIIKSEQIYHAINIMLGEYKSLLPLLATLMICMISTMNDITAPSVSLEGKSLYIIQSLPISAWQILKAKINLHLILTLIPSVILSVCISVVLRLGLPFTLMTIIASSLFVALSAMLGLMLNLKMPNLNWTNETVPIKQSAVVLICIFGGWAFVFLIGFIYYLLYELISPVAYLCAVCAALAAICFGLYKWLKNKGAKLLASL